MEKQTALNIIQALAQGIDPHSGEAFPAGSPYQHPDTVRALFQASQALTDSVGSPAQQSRAAPQNAGKPWSEEEDHALAAAFDEGKAIAELAEHHRRSRVAIEARLARLGKIEPPEQARFRTSSGKTAHAAR